jgi:tripartite-type tricarboxylate transporter receptor subunit TctC
MKTTLNLFAAGALLSAAMALPAAAQAQEFYKGKTVNFFIGSAAGGGYDAYSRLIANHIGRHLPGKPTVVAQNMPGAGSIRAANHLYNVAPKDGTAIGMVDQALYLNQILGTPELKADARKYNWIGRILSNSAVLFAWHTADVKTAEDAFKSELIISTTGAASKLNWTVMNNVLGTKFRIINGYSGSNESRLAMERREVDALSMPWSLLKNDAADWLAAKKINLLLQTGADKHPELPNVPRMIDLAKNDADRQLMELFSSPSTIGRSVVAPPGLPADRVAELRTAFMAAIKDPLLIADVEKAKLELDPLSGEDLQKAIFGAGDFPEALIARARTAAKDVGKD